jgi:hypothetical protein
MRRECAHWWCHFRPLRRITGRSPPVAAIRFRLTALVSFRDTFVGPELSPWGRRCCTGRPSSGRRYKDGPSVRSVRTYPSDGIHRRRIQAKRGQRCARAESPSIADGEHAHGRASDLPRSPVGTAANSAFGTSQTARFTGLRLEGAVGEAGERVAQALVACPAELGVLSFAGLLGHGGLAAVGGDRVAMWIPGAAVTDLGQERGGADHRLAAADEAAGIFPSGWASSAREISDSSSAICPTVTCSVATTRTTTDRRARLSTSPARPLGAERSRASS